MMADMDDEALAQVFEFALDLGRHAGKMLLDGMNSRISGASGASTEAKEKENSVDIVTKTDTDVESFIHAQISSRYPLHHFIGEETYANQDTKDYLVTDHPTWCVDPLDGTVNYTHLFPTYCVSIALLVHGHPVIGIIYAPFLSQLYASCRGRGAHLHHTHPVTHEILLSRSLPLLQTPAVPPMPASAPQKCILVCEWGKDRRDVPDGNLQRKVSSFTSLAKEVSAGGGMVHGVRSLGSATLDLALLATGGGDIWWEGGCWEWDVAAGIAILEEAGGLVTTANPPAGDLDRVEVPRVRLGSRLYLAIRPAGEGEGETGREGQERCVREVWKRVRGLGYTRPGA